MATEDFDDRPVKEMMEEETLPEVGSPMGMFEVLNVARRRAAILILDAIGAVSIDRLSDMLAAVENDVAVTEITSDQRKRIYIALYQTHAEKMASANVAEIRDERTMDLRATAVTEVAAKFVRNLSAHEEPEFLETVERVLSEEGFTDDRKMAWDPRFFRVPTPEQFRSMREAAGVTQTDLAEVAGCTPYVFVSFEGGETSPRAETLRVAMDHIRDELTDS